jgi:hypothetical protein
MIIYDVVHGYQPFAKDLLPDWVSSNLDRVFLPTSRAMAEGLVRRSVQLQGWTIDAWMWGPPAVRIKAQAVLENLRQAAARGHIEMGFSAYSHALLPLLGDRLAYAQMRADHDTVSGFVAEPKFFWFPECALDARKLRIVYERFPGAVAVVPNIALGMKTGGFVEIGCGKVRGRAAVCNVLVKDVLMNSVVYSKPPYVPAALDWKRSTTAMRSCGDFRYVLNALDDGVEHVIVRDWENGESRDALREKDGYADVAAMLDCHEASYRLLSEHGSFSMRHDIGEVAPSSWEPMSSRDDPYPYWTPAGASGWKARVVDHWLELLRLYEAGFEAALRSLSGAEGLDAVDEAFRNRRFHSMFRRTSPALLSCLPWHLLARDEWEKFPDFPRHLLERVVLPHTTEMLLAGGLGGEVERLRETVAGFVGTIVERGD